MTNVTLTTEQAQQIEEALDDIVRVFKFETGTPVEALAVIRAARAQEQAEQEPGAIEELAWEKYCEGTAGDMDVRDFWEELPKSVQEQYIAKVSCSYPNCNCPFDHPGGDWCAKGLSTNAAPVQQAEQKKQEPVGEVDLHKELGQLRWMGGDEGWDNAIHAVRKRLEELYAAPVDAKAIRAEALEEAAKVCEQGTGDVVQTDVLKALWKERERIAEVIRGLKWTS